MKKGPPRIAYKHKVALVILLFALLPCVVLEFVYLEDVRQDWKNSIVSDFQIDTDTSAMLLSKSITEMEAKMQHILNNFTLRSYLSRLKNLKLSQALDFVTETNNAVSSITVASPNLVVRWYPYFSTKSYGNHCYTMETFASEFPDGHNDQNYQRILSIQEGEFLWLVRDISRQTNNTGLPATRLCLYSQITSLKSQICIVEVSIPVTDLISINKSISVPESFFAACLNMDTSTQSFVFSSTLDSESSLNLLSCYTETKQVPKYEIIHSNIPNIPDSEILFLLPQTYVSTRMRPKSTSFLLITVIIALALFCVSHITSHFLTRRIVNEVNTINLDLENILNEPLHSDYNHNDIGLVTLRVHKLIQNVHDYCAKIEHYETERLRMELEILQLRFNPHLLYNTLGAISCQSKNSNVRNSVNSLCNYYRIVLNNGHLIIRFSDEISMIKEYLSILKFTYRLDNISCFFQIDEQIETYPIVKHLLQPIVENAINHGIRPTKRGGNLRIIATEEKNCIVIEVTDDGIGMSKEKAAQLLRKPAASVTCGGYGIYNVQQRIRVYYGNDYGLTINSKEGLGTTVIMRIPKDVSELS